MTGWRCGAIVGNADAIARYWQLKTNIDSGLFEAVQLAAVEALDRAAGARRARCARSTRAAATSCSTRCARSASTSSRRRARSTSGRRCPEGHTSASFCEEVLEEAAVVVCPGGAYGPNGEGFFRISLTVPDERLPEAVERMRGRLPEAHASDPPALGPRL